MSSTTTTIVRCILLTVIGTMVYLLISLNRIQFSTDNSSIVHIPKKDVVSVVNKDKIKKYNKEEVKEKIIRISKEYGFDPSIAIRIATCESQLGKYKYSWEHSTAKGVFQFTDGTWKNNCTGNVLNEEDNITCFVKMYNKHKSWWKCK